MNGNVKQPILASQKDWKLVYSWHCTSVVTYVDKPLPFKLNTVFKKQCNTGVMSLLTGKGSSNYCCCIDGYSLATVRSI